MYAHAVTQQFYRHCCHSFNVCHDCLSPVEDFPRDVDKVLLDVFLIWSLRSLFDGSEELVDLKLIHQLEIAFVCCLEDGVWDVPPDNLGNPLRDPLLGADCSDAEDVLPIGFFLCVAVVRYLWLDGAVIGAVAFGGRS